MSSPTTGPDLSKLPVELQQLIAAEIAKALEAAKPAQPKELTPAEKAALYLEQAQLGLRGEKPISPGSQYVHDRILAILDILIDSVFPQVADPQEDATEHEGGVL